MLLFPILCFLECISTLNLCKQRYELERIGKRVTNFGEEKKWKNKTPRAHESGSLLCRGGGNCEQHTQQSIPQTTTGMNKQQQVWIRVCTWVKIYGLVDLRLCGFEFFFYYLDSFLSNFNKKNIFLKNKSTSRPVWLAGPMARELINIFNLFNTARYSDVDYLFCGPMRDRVGWGGTDRPVYSPQYVCCLLPISHFFKNLKTNFETQNQT